jgi:two-component system sensor histidine kinase/response regulator
MIHESAQDALGYIRRYLEIQSERASEQSRSADAAHAPLREVVDWLVGRYGLQLESRGQLLRVRDPVGDGVVAIDTLVLRQVAENLLSNAMKYAPGSGVELSVRHGAPGYWQLRVEDRGPGIAASKQRQLFKPFVRLSEVDPADGLSSGLGLSLAKQIIEKNGGQLWYEDREGGGARFVIELPIADATSLASPPQAPTIAIV